ncbi:glyoxalase family protein [Grosmannia clavigera kw1407]|uniref:Glyoxalase family protein n=1 Tax=Grosmannia clavigera (strain kw1407 / UAMH 11150) TaxID=655863 RepID=F0XQN5_GROCL|nr:glyoxalase family protein [Grosmannia clavigera kw1407]EFW99727.1 glyoxalase family protein [Grosmannia clavigera kw1407]
MITGIAHVNIVVPPGTLDQAHAFYGDTLGFVSSPVPVLQRGSLAWFNIADSGQQVHVAFGKPGDFSDDAVASSRHPCFRLTGGRPALEALQQRVWQHFSAGSPGAPRACDEPGRTDSGAQGAEYPTRFFARDYAGNRLEFSL